MANSTTGLLGLCSYCPNSRATTAVSYIILFLLGVAILFAVGEVQGAKLEDQRTITELREMKEILQIIRNDLDSHGSTTVHLPLNETMSLHRSTISRQLKSLEGEREEVLSKVGRFEHLMEQTSLEQDPFEQDPFELKSKWPKLFDQKFEEQYKRLQSHQWAWSREKIAQKMTRLREQSAKLLQFHTSYVAERNTSILKRIERMMAVQETKLDASWEKLNLLTEQQGSILRVIVETRGVPNDEILRAPSASVSGNENDSRVVPQQSPPAFRESPILALRDLLPVARN